MIMVSGERPDMEIKEIMMQSMAEPAKVKLTRGAKGTYQWEISLSAETLNLCLSKVRDVDDLLKEMYCGKNEQAYKQVFEE